MMEGIKRWSTHVAMMLHGCLLSYSFFRRKRCASGISRYWHHASIPQIEDVQLFIVIPVLYNHLWMRNKFRIGSGSRRLLNLPNGRHLCKRFIGFPNILCEWHNKIGTTIDIVPSHFLAKRILSFLVYDDYAWSHTSLSCRTISFDTAGFSWSGSSNQCSSISS